VLDLGCGRGRNSRYLARVGFSVVGVDISRPHRRQSAAKRYLGRSTIAERFRPVAKDLNRQPP
jgi:cyclopropane fatty-acyl-phospholipid synthase-like methyltransferase